MADAGGTSGPRHRAGPRHRRTGPSRELLACACILVVGVGVEVLVTWFISSRGVFLSGDQATYIAQAQTYLHLSPQIQAVIRSDAASHVFLNPLHPVTIETFPGHHGVIGPFAPGLSLLLLPFVATGRLYQGAAFGIITLTVAGLILIHRRATLLAGLHRRGQVLLAVMLASPAVLVAATQIYPDLLSGVLIAGAVLEIALLEQRGRLTGVGLVVLLVAISFLPWLQVKNFAPAALVAGAVAVALVRARAPRRLLAVIGVPALLSWLVLLAYNGHYFGHVLGLPEPPVRLTWTGVEYLLGLSFGRDQGLFVQVPFAVLGLVGLWMARRRLPIAVLATVAALGAILVLNGTYTSNPYGGGALAGRFMWTLIPATVAWSAVVVARWERAGRSLWGPSVLIGGAWLYEAVPILADAHNYFNVFVELHVWDPLAVTGWWPGLDRVLPTFDLPGTTFGSPATGLAFELGVLALVAIASVQYARPGRFTTASLVALGALAVLLVAAVAVSEPALPGAAYAIDVASTGAPIEGGAGPATTEASPLLLAQPGTYRVTMAYRLTGLDRPPGDGRLLLICASMRGAITREASARLPAAGRAVAVGISCPGHGEFYSQLTVAAHTRLDVDAFRLRKTAA